jgi:urease subunit alpha
MTCEPLVYKPQWGAAGPARHATSLTFMAQSAIDAGVPERIGMRKQAAAASGTRSLTKRDLVHNDALPSISVDPETYRVEVDGELATCEPMTSVPLGRLYVLK